MSIKNEPKIKNPLIAAIREQLEHRALWMYLLCEKKQKSINCLWIVERRICFLIMQKYWA